jgi:hypothetical protein
MDLAPVRTHRLYCTVCAIVRVYMQQQNAEAEALLADTLVPITAFLTTTAVLKVVSNSQPIPLTTPFA